MALLYLLAGAHRRRARDRPGDRPRDQPRLARRPGGRSRGARRDRRPRRDPGGRDLARRAPTPTASMPDGVIVAPGFIDLHVHLREPGNEDAETVATGLAAAAHGGFTTVCAMPNTTPALDEPGVLARVRAAAAASGSPVELLAHGAVTAGRRGRDAGGARRAGRRGRRRVQRRRRAGRAASRSCDRARLRRARSGCRSSTTPRTRR